MLLFGHRHEGVDELDVGGMDNGAADEAVGLVQDDFAEQTVDLVVDHGFAAHEVVLEAMLGKLLEHELFRGTEIFPDGAGDHVVVVSGADIDDVGKALADDHDVIQGVVDASADAEDGTEVCSADTDLQHQILVLIQNPLDPGQLIHPALLVRNFLVLDNRHTVNDLTKFLVQITKVSIVFITVFSIEFWKIYAAETFDLMFCETCAEMLELLQITDTYKDKRNLILVECTIFNRGRRPRSKEPCW